MDSEKAGLLNLRATEASLRDVPRKLSENEAAVEKASELQKRIAQMQAAYKTYRETVRDLGQRQAVAKANLKRWQDAQDALKTVRTAFYAHQAGFLAETLREGEPCPVCGSKEHPAPARVPADAPTEEQMKKAEVAEKEAGARSSQSSKLSGETAARAETMGKNLRQLLSQAFGVTDPEADIAAVLKEQEETCAARLAALKAQGDRFREKVQRLTEVTAGIETGEARVTDLTGKLETARAAHEEAKTALSSAEAELRQLRERPALPNPCGAGKPDYPQAADPRPPANRPRRRPEEVRPAVGSAVGRLGPTGSRPEERRAGGRGPVRGDGRLPRRDGGGGVC